jgi:hypothetical protein
MKRYTTIESLVLVLLVVCLLAGTTEAKKNVAKTRAKKILDTTGVQGGIVVHLGCGDGKLTEALRVSDRYTVHGLEANPAKVADARSYIHAQGIYGQVSIEQYSGSELPYTDNLVNLVVVQDAGKVSMDEVMRVLAPGERSVFSATESGKRPSKPGLTISTSGLISYTMQATTRLPTILLYGRPRVCSGLHRRCGFEAMRRLQGFRHRYRRSGECSIYLTKGLSALPMSVFLTVGRSFAGTFSTASCSGSGRLSRGGGASGV